MSKAFSQRNKIEAAEFNGKIKKLLAEHYDVTESRIHEYDMAMDGEYKYTDEERGQQLLDFCGFDWVVDLDYKVVGVAQRVRNVDSGTDMSVKVKNGQGRTAEWKKIYNGWNEGGAYPNQYVHAVRDGDDLIQFVLVDVDEMCQAIKDGALRSMGPYSAGKGHGVLLEFYSVSDLRDAGCVLAEWEPGDDDE